MTAFIYRNENFEPFDAEFRRLEEIAGELRASGIVPDALITELDRAVRDCRQASMACRRVTRGGRQVGYGVDGSAKAIACETAIAILREIKKAKGW